MLRGVQEDLNNYRDWVTQPSPHPTDTLPSLPALKGQGEFSYKELKLVGSAGYSRGLEALVPCSLFWGSTSGLGKKFCLVQPPWKDARCTALGSTIPIVQCTTYTLV